METDTKKETIIGNFLGNRMKKMRMSKMAIEAGKCLQKAVQEELKRKALLGQHVIINRNGKACRVSAKQALKMTKSK